MAADLTTNEAVQGTDNRVQVRPKTSPPYKWICALKIVTHDGQTIFGSGFKINLPEIHYTVVVTAGHCTYINRRYAKSILVTFPGKCAIKASMTKVYAHPEYIKSQSKNYDYGLILLRLWFKTSAGFGWSSIIPDEEVETLQVTNCGYPGDKPRGTLWITGGPIKKITQYRIYYMNDTYRGGSGSPVYAWYNGYWTVVGIHTKGSCKINSGVRFTPDIIKQFYLHINALNSIQSVHFQNVRLHCDGEAPVQGGKVNCQYSKPKNSEHFRIYPLEMKPSLAPLSAFPVLILSATRDNVYISMDGSGMTASNGAGGTVNYQRGGGTSERFFCRQERPKTYSFRSMEFPNCYLRLDGTGVTKGKGSGSGTVNCQYYEDPDNHPLATDWVNFKIPFRS